MDGSTRVCKLSSIFSLLDANFCRIGLRRTRPGPRNGTREAQTGSWTAQLEQGLEIGARMVHGCDARLGQARKRNQRIG